MADTNYEIMEIGKGSWRIEEGGVRSLLFEGTERALLVDSGFGKGNIREVAESLTQKPIMLVNTHADEDHVGCNALFDKAFMHPAEFAYYHGSCPKGAAAEPLWDGEVIDIGERAFEVILIPGHTPGSIALLDQGNRILVAGDSVSESAIFMFGEIRSLQAHIHSMRKLLTYSEAFDEIYPAHGPCPISQDIIGKLIRGGECVLRGEAEVSDPPFDIPAKVHRAEGAAFFYSKEE
jgi:glyoxylase-like metal-dependent hydrolase (beta-lactamase superfamily II)